MGSKYKAKQFIDAIPGSGGIVSTIAGRVGCNWRTAKRWVTEFPTVKQAYEDECEVPLDMAHSVVIESIKKKNVGDAKWYLTKKGQSRGFVEVKRQQNINYDVSKLSNEQLLRIIKGEDPLDVIDNAG